jgi:hypothetical protein
MKVLFVKNITSYMLHKNGVDIIGSFIIMPDYTEDDITFFQTFGKRKHYSVQL